MIIRILRVHWVRHAVAAGRLVDRSAEQDSDAADAVSAIALADALAHFAELPEWETVTLKDVADHATLMNTPENREPFGLSCTCGAFA
jgi:hypothetical protein